MPYDDATGSYIPPTVSGYYPTDPYNFGAPASQNKQRGVDVPYGAKRFKFDTKVIDRLPEGDIIAWKTIIEDTQGGLNLTQGRIDLDFDRVSSSSLDTRFYKTLLNHQLTTTQTSPVLGGTTDAFGVHSAMFNGTLHIAGGATANSAILHETSTSDPTLTAVTYTPTNNIISLNTGTFGSISGSNNLPYLIVGRSGAVGQALSNAYATTNMATTSLYGVIQTQLDGQPWLCYYDGKLGSLDVQNQPLNALPTTTLNAVPNGGCALGLVKLAGAPTRAAWLWPHANSGTFTVAILGGKIVTTNQEGGDYQYVPMGLANIYSAVCINGAAFAATDKKRVMYYDGRSQPRDLFWLTQREADSDVLYRCVALAVNGNEIIAEINTVQASDGNPLRRWLESYNVETNAWHQISASQGGDVYGSDSLLSAPMPAGLPYSQATNFVHSYVNHGSGTTPEWRRTLAPIYGYNPYNMLRQTEGAGASTGYEFESSGTYTSPYWTLPGLEGCPAMVSRIHFMGDVDSGGTSGTAATVQVTAGNLTASFSTGLSRRAQMTELQDSGEVFYQLQVQITQTRNSGSTRWTPNGLPIAIEGYAWMPTLPPPYGWVDDGR